MWVLSAGKPGDDTQATMLADAVGWPYTVKRLGVDPLAAPWPQVVISSGRVSEAAARGIAAASAGAVRLVQLGRPHGPLSRLDLVVALPQYDLPDHPRVVRLALPLQRVSLPAIARAAAAWTPPPGAPLPRPWIAVLVGGTARPYVLDVSGARDLGERLSAAARAAGGSLLVTTSRRTAPAAGETLAAALSAPAVVHRWSPEALANPYLAFLGAANRIVVTADSASMIADAVSTGKPVEIVALPRVRRGRLRDVVRRLAWGGARSRVGGALLAPVVARLGIRPPRDLSRLHRALYERGLAAPFGAEPAGHASPDSADELAAVAARVRALVR
jgi:hypothetical protein